MSAGGGQEPNLGDLLQAGLHAAADFLARSPRPAGLGRHDNLISSLHALSPAEFESWVADRLREAGFSVSLTGGPGDNGIDILARRRSELVVVQCKRYRSAVVAGHMVRELLGSMTAVSATRGILVTTGTVTRRAEQYARQQKHTIELWDGPYLVQRWGGSIPHSSTSRVARPSTASRRPIANRSVGRRVRPPVQRTAQQPPWPLI